MRLIDADAFIAEINERIDAAIKWGTNAIADRNEETKIRAEQAVATFCEASLTAKKMPTIEERKTGRWLISDGACEHDYMECSRCKWITEYYGGLEEEWGYCPNCGAYMRGEEHETTDCHDSK